VRRDSIQCDHLHAKPSLRTPQGAGRRLFEDVEEHVPLDVVQSAIFGNGVVNVTYAPANADEASAQPPVVGFPEPVTRGSRS
jgi:hypothetical protein